MVAIHRGAVGGGGGVARLGIASRTARAEILARLLDVRDRFIAEVARAARSRLAGGGACHGMPLAPPRAG